MTVIHVVITRDGKECERYKLEEYCYRFCPLRKLPDHLLKTLRVLYVLKHATASEVSRMTGRARAVESGYLNQLVIMNLVGKHREGQIVIFNIESF